MTQRLGVRHARRTTPSLLRRQRRPRRRSRCRRSRWRRRSACSPTAAGGPPPSPVIQVLGAGRRRGARQHDGDRDRREQAIPEVVADNVTDVLQGVLTDGTAAGKGIDRPAAGKTGTAEDNANAWFVGYTPSLSTAVWLGHQSGNIEMSGILGVRGGMTGGAVPAATWQRFMKRRTGRGAGDRLQRARADPRRSPTRRSGRRAAASTRARPATRRRPRRADRTSTTPRHRSPRPPRRPSRRRPRPRPPPAPRPPRPPITLFPP